MLQPPAGGVSTWVQISDLTLGHLVAAEDPWAELDLVGGEQPAKVYPAKQRGSQAKCRAVGDLRQLT